jgi:hypothetical protein
MSEQNEKNPSGDITLAIVAVLVFGLGAFATYSLTHKSPQESGPVTIDEGAPIGKSAPGAVPPKTGAPGGNMEATATAIAIAPKSEPAPAADSEFKPVTFATLASFLYELPNTDDPVQKPAAKDQIPQPIKAMNGMKVAVQGFMVPVDLKNGKTSTFLLVKDQSLCCFGRMPRMNEWVSVKMRPGKSARVIQDQPVTVFGNLEVGEVFDKGEVLSVYRIDSDDVAGPLDL